MGNFITNNGIELQDIIDATKEDISQDYDLTTVEGVEKANDELLRSFARCSEKDLNQVRTQLFVQNKNSQ